MPAAKDEPLAFDENEKILCFHGPLLYEAKVLKAEYWKDRPDGATGPHYFVHYKGWKQTWDEWVPQDRVLKYNEENLKKQKDLEVTAKVEKNKQKAETRKAANEGGTDKGKKRARESMADKEEEFTRKPEIKIAIPEALKTRLVEDWENITKNQQLVSLPRDVTVTQILNNFRDFLKEGERKSKKGKQSEDSKAKALEIARLDDTINEVVDGLGLYFDKALGNILLYRFERQQYAEIKKQHPDKKMSDLYGAEHLLRLFVQLPTLVAHTNMDQDAVNILKDYFVKFLEYLQKHQQQLFLSEYDNATPAYISTLKAS
ncbi:Esa1p-associated factor [Rhizophlyctis rosea]|nr:Esa1p-associated factor [Rhizophlyctis rosea]